ncbi:MAG: site-specific DNA-methyltransferase [Acidimicrobiia bacterium]|nr:site-specific DNA-methyltransferase [Acidimicrobiia bacterium]MCY4457148.1 site-specific DNA-methyltransferase [Acidimicrobiaceae bacterium]
MIIRGEAREHLRRLPAASVDLSFWSPPYYVGKSYEEDLTFEAWQDLLREVIKEHPRILKPGGFLAVNIADILCFPDPSMPRFQADNVSRKTSPITRADVLAARTQHPDANRHQLAEFLGCSEQTVQRRLEGNNARGGKHNTPTRVLLTGALVATWAQEAGMYLYDQRIWHKDPCWANSRWHSNSYRAVDEFEHVYIFWTPGVTTYNRNRLTASEWGEWGSRGVWNIPSVRRNNRHEAEFPEELARRVIRLFCPAGGMVLDPFVGSGTTTAVAAALGCQWTGIELDPMSARIAEQRTSAAAEQCALIA